jgi:hypothetical protein
MCISLPRARCTACPAGERQDASAVRARAGVVSPPSHPQPPPATRSVGVVMGLRSPRQTCTGCLIALRQLASVIAAFLVKWLHSSPHSRHVWLPDSLPTLSVISALVCDLRAECRLLMRGHHGLAMLACGAATFLIFTARTAGGTTSVPPIRFCPGSCKPTWPMLPGGLDRAGSPDALHQHRRE